MLPFLSNIPSSLRESFSQAVEFLAAEMEISVYWLLLVMKFESNVNPQAVNRYTGATGLIQFMPSTAESLGTTTTALKQMDAVQQMVYVRKYFQPYFKKIKSPLDLYLAVFFPAAIGKPADYVLETTKISASKIAQQNPIFDINKDNKVTLTEVWQAFLSKVPMELKALLNKVEKKKELLSLGSPSGLVLSPGVSIKPKRKK